MILVGLFNVHSKDIEKHRRDTNKETEHEHIKLNDETKIPPKWRDLLGCRKCKRELVVYIGNCLLRIGPRYLRHERMLVVGGACDGTERDKTWGVTKSAGGTFGTMLLE